MLAARFVAPGQLLGCAVLQERCVPERHHYELIVPDAESGSPTSTIRPVSSVA